MRLSFGTAVLHIEVVVRVSRELMRRVVNFSAIWCGSDVGRRITVTIVDLY